MKTGDTEHVDMGDLRQWMFRARDGQSMIYALGDLAHDRMPGNIGTLNAVAAQVMAWERAGYVYAFQRRDPPHGFAYIVRRRGSVALETQALAG